MFSPSHLSSRASSLQFRLSTTAVSRCSFGGFGEIVIRFLNDSREGISVSASGVGG